MELPPGLKTFHTLPAHRTENYIILQYHSKIHQGPPPQLNLCLRTNNPQPGQNPQPTPLCFKPSLLEQINGSDFFLTIISGEERRIQVHDIIVGPSLIFT